MLNRDSSAISKTLLQCGQFGRLKSLVAKTLLAGTLLTGTWVARTPVDALWHADCTIIVDPSSTLAHRTQSLAMLRVAYGAAATPS
jgi:hypothetical protein